MMDRNVFYQLLEKYFDGSSNIQEEKELFTLLNNLEKTEEWNDEAMGVKSEIEKKMLQRLNSSIQEMEESRSSKVISFHYWKYIAAAVILVTLGGILYLNEPNGALPKLNKHTHISEREDDIAPVKDKAILTLADGSTVVLSNIENGTIAKEGNTIVTKTSDGQLVYRAASNTSANRAMNVLSTPAGGSYKIILPDGTTVWLNAGSSLKFPTAFTNAERVVQLQGEAYFEVVKVKSGVKSIPFFVETNRSKIKVLGTEFNVMAYADEPVQETTLIEGSVSITPAKMLSAQHNTSARILKPGQQAILKNGSTELQVENQVNTASVIAWKSGVFLFESASMDQVMRQISRWYGAEIVYEGVRPNVVFSGMVPRSSYVSKLLKVLEATGKVKFEIQKNQIIVKRT